MTPSFLPCAPAMDSYADPTTVPLPPEALSHPNPTAPVMPTPTQFRSVAVQSPAPVPWSTGLCDCCDDVENCCVTCFCPCITFGRIAEIVDKGSTTCGASGGLYALILCATGCNCLYSCFYRSKMRGQFFLEESPFADCVVHCCCESCALCQEYRELKGRGYDLHRGWQGNMGAIVPPVVHGAMSRV